VQLITEEKERSVYQVSRRGEKGGIVSTGKGQVRKVRGHEGKGKRSKPKKKGPEQPPFKKSGEWKRGISTKSEEVALDKKTSGRERGDHGKNTATNLECREGGRDKRRRKRKRV